MRNIFSLFAPAGRPSARRAFKLKALLASALLLLSTLPRL